VKKNIYINAPENESKCTRLRREYLFQRNPFEWDEKNINLSQNTCKVF
jgi:hypothetical protein